MARISPSEKVNVARWPVGVGFNAQLNIYIARHHAGHEKATDGCPGRIVEDNSELPKRERAPLAECPIPFRTTSR